MYVFMHVCNAYVFNLDLISISVSGWWSLHNLHLAESSKLLPTRSERREELATLKNNGCLEKCQPIVLTIA